MEWLQVGTHQVSLQLWLLWIFACPLGLEDIFLMNIEFTATNLANYMWYMPLFVMISVHAVTDQVKLTWLGGRKESGFWFWFWFGIYLFIYFFNVRKFHKEEYPDCNNTMKCTSCKINREKFNLCCTMISSFASKIEFFMTYIIHLVTYTLNFLNNWSFNIWYWS